MKSNRDEFALDTKRALADRAGNKCSFPGCRAPTAGPSDEKPAARSNVGTACHIAAAAGGRGARRYVPDMLPKQRRAIENGIWMCRTHGVLVDTDEVRFTIPMLQKWREVAEFHARLEVEAGGPVDFYASAGGLGLVEHTLALTGVGEENSIIGDALLDCCVSQLWGEELAHAVRDFSIEVVRNAFAHGQAKHFELHISARSIRIIEDGAAFDPLLLPEHPARSGGAIAVEHLLQQHGHQLVVSVRRLDTKNEILVSLVRSPEEVHSVTPCSFYLDRRSLHNEDFNIDAFSDCKTLYVILPEYMCVSDVELLAYALKDVIGERSLVLVGRDFSGLVGRILSGRFPQSRIMRL